MKKTYIHHILLYLAYICILGTSIVPVLAASEDLSVLSLDELLDLDVVSVARVPEKVTQSSAAIYVITQETLRRSGVNSIPEALRMVPGMHVYRINANKWAISARGFAGRFANKMLVMIDGRTVYTPLFSGVFWDVQDTMIEDIDRIEVIRGPGGTLWGTNAVNGVINIITKESADTQGGLLSMEAGSHDTGTIGGRYGGWLNDSTSYRIYGKFFDRDNFETPSGDYAADNYHIGRAGFRMDKNLDGGDTMTLQGDIYSGMAAQLKNSLTLSAPYSNEFEDEAQLFGGNLLGRWNHVISNSSDMSLQLYYDRHKRDGEGFAETLDTFDVDFQHRFALTKNQELLWGLGFRHRNNETSATIDPVSGLYNLSLDPEKRNDELFSGFIQDRLSFADGKGEAKIGTKIEHNDYSGLEWQPSASLLWNFSDTHAIWTAISRTVRTPSRAESNATYNAHAFFNPGIPPAGMVTVMRVTANDEIDSEKMMSYELGYRIRPTETIFIDIAAFYSHYDDLTGGIDSGTPFPEPMPNPSHMVMPVTVDNSSDGESYGFELSGNWSVVDWWRLNVGYTWFHLNILNDDDVLFQRPGFGEDQQAQNKVTLSSYMDLPANFELNATLSYIDKLLDMDIDSYVNCDLNLVWHPSRALTVTVGVRNLFDDSHSEFSSSQDGIIGSEIPRNVYGKLVWTF